jgi:ParB family transcriptional regulator, chromosome partitioning protein
VEQEALSPATAYEVSKLEDPAGQREVAARVVSEGLSRAETVEAVEAVRQVASKPTRAGGSKAKGRGASKAAAKLPTERTVKVDGGFKVTVSGRKGFELETLLAVLEEVTAKIREESELAAAEAA